MTADTITAINKSLEGVTPDRLRYEADAMYAAVQGQDYGDTFHAFNWADKPHRVIYDAINLIRDSASEIDRLQRENASLRSAQTYTYIGRDGKSVLARDLEDRAEAAEAKVKRQAYLLEKVAPAEFSKSWLPPQDYEMIRTALASTEGERHADK